MPLARLETRIAFATLLQRCPGLTLTTDSITYRPGVTIRGLTALPVTFDPTGVSYQEPVQNMPEQSSLAALTATAGCPFHRQNT
jgi:hypothetical protein